MASVLILYSTTDGQTLRICQRVQQRIVAAGQEAALVSIDDAASVSLDRFDKVVIGARIRYGKHQPQVFAFIRKHLDRLQSMPTAFFSVNIVARKPEKNRPDTNPYVRKFFKRTPWTPGLVDVFAGKLDYPRYRFFDRLMIRFIMLMTKGPTDPTAVVEFTDWSRVEAFAEQVCAL
ncbi:menaquinone-dependent protoporphyrinogen IX dehydrogenase [Propionivibrio dicarboxylicus]|uniref:Protoporphyrinogen IX dehydrogenase [quinone] n=1 Tax=Propionivibrio dicarboxylicus TaxID=83767 RepID=A0A1G8FRB8_9RHOO|nr:menaquinone-dependent protoporphyrinogen IX dehydrogenase [Propionivibrio dicarboxylicus]SDH84688.1 menaquinone-dependent protoporphyrinogen oxidase [Propionivibrio dicarboxylicus]